MVNGLRKKLLSHLIDIKEQRSSQQLVKEIRSKLMTFELPELNDMKVEELKQSEWFEKLHKSFCSSKRKGK